MVRTSALGRLHFVALFVAALLASTAPAAHAEDPLTPQQIAGTWRWSASTGGELGLTVTPVPPDFTQVEFEVDGTLRVSRKGLLSVGTYRLEDDRGTQILVMELPPGTPRSIPLVQDEYAISRTPSGGLALEDRCRDCWVHEYTFDTQGLVPLESSSVSALRARWQRPR